MIINSRRDLEALRGTNDYAAALRAIAGATSTWINTAGYGVEPVWERVAVLDMLDRLGLTEAELLAELAAAGIAPVSPEPPAAVESAPPTAESVAKERSRRLALGFDYNFGGARGTHHIGTTPDDMEGWKEVTDFASAALNLSQPNTEIQIATNTGDVAITALEWQLVLVAAAQFRQPLWAASFALQAMDPIPADYTADSYWT